MTLFWSMLADMCIASWSTILFWMCGIACAALVAALLRKPSSYTPLSIRVIPSNDHGHRSPSSLSSTTSLSRLEEDMRHFHVTFTLRGNMLQLLQNSHPLFPTVAQWRTCILRHVQEVGIQCLQAIAQPEGTTLYSFTQWCSVPPLHSYADIQISCRWRREEPFDGPKMHIDFLQEDAPLLTVVVASTTSMAPDGSTYSVASLIAPVGPNLPPVTIPTPTATATIATATKATYEMLLWIHHQAPGNRRIPFLSTALVDTAIRTVRHRMDFDDAFLSEFRSKVLDPFTEDGGPSISGAIFSGLPGGGKTELLFRLTELLPVRFHLFGPSDFTKPHAGEAEAYIQTIFQRPKQVDAQHVLHYFLFDEADAYMCRRELVPVGDYRHSSITTVVAAMGAPTVTSSQQRNVYFVGTTNHPENIDEPLLRAGRFQESIVFLLPSIQPRMRILQGWVDVQGERMARTYSDGWHQYLGRWTLSLSPAELCALRSTWLHMRPLQASDIQQSLTALGEKNVRLNHLCLVQYSRVATDPPSTSHTIPLCGAWWVAVLEGGHIQTVPTNQRPTADTFGRSNLVSMFAYIMSLKSGTPTATFSRSQWLTRLHGLALHTGCTSFRYLGQRDMANFTASTRPGLNLTLADYLAKEVSKARNGGKTMVVLDVGCFSNIVERTNDSSTTVGASAIFASVSYSFSFRDFVEDISPDLLRYLKVFVSLADANTFIPVLVPPSLYQFNASRSQALLKALADAAYSTH